MVVAKKEDRSSFSYCARACTLGVLSSAFGGLVGYASCKFFGDTNYILTSSCSALSALAMAFTRAKTDGDLSLSSYGVVAFFGAIVGGFAGSICEQFQRFNAAAQAVSFVTNFIGANLGVYALEKNFPSPEADNAKGSFLTQYEDPDTPPTTQKGERMSNNGLITYIKIVTAGAIVGAITGASISKMVGEPILIGLWRGGISGVCAFLTRSIIEGDIVHRHAIPGMAASFSCLAPPLLPGFNPATSLGAGALTVAANTTLANWIVPHLDGSLKPNKLEYQ